jgi:dihydrofolate reductase
MIQMILSTTKDNAIGINGQLCVESREDLQHFKTKTEGSTIIMGRSTWESLPVKPLPNRKSVVISSTTIDGVETWDNLPHALKAHPDCWIIGGKRLFEEGLEYADSVYITRFFETCPEPEAVRLKDRFIECLNYHYVVYPYKKIEGGIIFHAQRNKNASIHL